MNELLDAERKTEPSIDYFATSLPNFLVFEDDLAFRKEIECTFTEALVELGLGNELDAARRLQQVVDKDPNHLAAQTMLAQIGRTGDSVIDPRHGSRSRPEMNIVYVANESPPASAPVKSLYVWIVASIAALGGFLFGYDWVVIGGAKPFYEKFFALTLPSQQGWAMSCALIGCLLGALASGALSERFGRKNPLILAAVIFCLSSIGTGMADHFQIFVFWRILGGFAIGLASSLSPVYIAELAPAHLRGKLVSMNQLTIVCGILLAQVVNWLIARPISPTAAASEILNSWNGKVGWRWMFGVTAIPSLLFLTAMFFVPESPRWLTRHGAPDKAKAVLTSIGGESYSEGVYSEIESSIAAEHAEASLQTLFHPKIRRILWLGIFLAVLQQWCGINVIFNFAEEVFSAAGFPVSDILFNIVVTGAVNVLFTIIALRTVSPMAGDADAARLCGACDHLPCSVSSTTCTAAASLCCSW